MMNRKQKNILLLSLGLVLLALVIIMASRPKSGTLHQLVSQFAISDTSTVSKIFLADKEGRQVLLERQPDGTWELNNTYLARAQAVDQMLSTLLRVAVSSPVPSDAHNSVISRMAAIGVKVEVYQRTHRIRLGSNIKLLPYEKRTRTFYVGDNTQDNMGTFMLMEGSERPYIVYIPGFRGYVSTRFSTKENDWRDHGIFSHNVFDIASVKLEMQNQPERSFTIENIDNRHFRLIPHDPEFILPAIDSIRLLTYMTTFNDIRYEVLLNEMDPAFVDSVRFSPPLFRVTLIDKEGIATSVVTHRRMLQDEEEYDLEGFPVYYDRDRMYAFINDGQDFILVQFYVFDRITRPLEWFFEGSTLTEHGSLPPEFYQQTTD